MNLGSFFEPDLKGEFVYNIDRKGIFFYRIGGVGLNALSYEMGQTRSQSGHEDFTF